MDLSEAIAKVFKEWGKAFAADLKESADRALKEGGRKNPNAIKLDFNEIIKVTSDGNIVLDISAVNGKKPVKYWGAIEEGRKKGVRRLPADVVGKVWQNEQGIDPRVVLLNMKNKISAKPRKFTRLKKTLDYDKAAKTLSFVIQNSIYKKGIKPKPFVNRVLTEENIQDLRNKLIPVMGEHFKLIIKGLE
jgi:hypothetical protein